MGGTDIPFILLQLILLQYHNPVSTMTIDDIKDMDHLASLATRPRTEGSHRASQIENLSPVPQTLSKVSNANADLVCQLFNALQSLEVPADDYVTWLCLAIKESDLNASSVTRNEPLKDHNGCSTERFGVLGLSEPTCKGVEGSDDCWDGTCELSCVDLLNNTINSVTCLHEAMHAATPRIHRYWDICESANDRLNAHYVEIIIHACPNFNSSRLPPFIAAGIGVLLFGCLVWSVWRITRKPVGRGQRTPDNKNLLSP